MMPSSTKQKKKKNETFISVGEMERDLDLEKQFNKMGERKMMQWVN
jgi:hypothetical protein